MRRTPCQRSARWALFCRARFGFRSFGGFGGREGAAFGVWRLAFGVQRSAFSVQRSAFSVQRSAFSVQRSAFSVQRSAFSVQRSAFSVQRSAFSVQRSAFSVGRGFSLGFRSRWTPAGISFLARRPPCDSVAAATGADTGARRSHSTNRTAESPTARATNT
ncbi:hypothetical protein H10_13915 [Burkholderia pseudomallei]|nr:hypothetical protein H10_13915 [Burkholderia pseudomallei]